LVKKQREETTFGGQDVGERFILRSILRKKDVRLWTGFKWLRMGSGGRFL
jgi:hypothetical protein